MINKVEITKQLNQNSNSAMVELAINQDLLLDLFEERDEVVGDVFSE